MRDRETFKTVGEIAMLLQFLYAHEDNKVKFNNGVTDLEIRMDENLEIMCTDLSYPELGETVFSEAATPAYMVGIIDYLKNTPSSIPGCKSAWFELTVAVSSAWCLMMKDNSNEK